MLFLFQTGIRYGYQQATNGQFDQLVAQTLVFTHHQSIVPFAVRFFLFDLIFGFFFLFKVYFFLGDVVKTGFDVVPITSVPPLFHSLSVLGGLSQYVDQENQSGTLFEVHLPAHLLFLRQGFDFHWCLFLVHWDDLLSLFGRLHGHLLLQHLVLVLPLYALNLPLLTLCVLVLSQLVVDVPLLFEFGVLQQLFDGLRIFVILSD